MGTALSLFSGGQGAAIPVLFQRREGRASGVISFLLHSCSIPALPRCQAVRRLERREMSETFELWQMKLVLEFFSSRSHQERMSRNPTRGLFMNSEFLPVMKCTIDNTLDQWLQGTRRSFNPKKLTREERVF